VCSTSFHCGVVGEVDAAIRRIDSARTTISAWRLRLRRQTLPAPKRSPGLPGWPREDKRSPTGPSVRVHEPPLRAACGLLMILSACLRSFSTTRSSLGVRAVEFVLAWGPDGQPTSAFRPDFYLTQHDLFLELTTLRQELVTVKNRKLRQMAQLYPEVRVGFSTVAMSSVCWESTSQRRPLDWPGDTQTHPRCIPSTSNSVPGSWISVAGRCPVVPRWDHRRTSRACRNDAAVFD